MMYDLSEAEQKLDLVRHALTAEPRIDLLHHPIRLAYDDGVLTLEGELSDVAAKRIALERAAAVPGVRRIIDRLRVTPAQAMTDGEIRDHVRNALLRDSALADCSIRVWIKGAPEVVRAPDGAQGAIDIRVEDGVVTLDGDVPGWGRKRIAGVLAWWVPGSRDVINGLGVTPPENDSYDEIADAVRMALEMDPFVDASQIRIGVANAVVTLTGLVPSDSETEMAEFDAWYVFGVDGVVNRIEVRRGPATGVR